MQKEKLAMLPSLMKGIVRIFFLSGVFFLVQCGSYQKAGETVLAPTPIVVTSLESKLLGELETLDLKKSVPVFICSSRNILDRSPTVDPFGNKRSDKLVPYLAVADVSLGAKISNEQILYETLNEVRHKRTRVKVEKITMYESPNVTPFSTTEHKKREFMKNKWLSTIRTQLKKSKRKNITVFVHGYNTHLVSNTELLGEMHHYGGRDGVVVNYEWPSAGKLLGYFQDKGNAEHSTRLFRSFISRLAVMTGADSVRIIAHSAGNPIVVNALKELRLIDKDLSANKLHKKYKISQVILAAPDMDSMRFMNAIFDRFYEMTPSVSVYAYPKDRALMISSKLFGVSRLGNAIGKLTGWERVALKQAKNVELIDVTVPQGMFGSLLGHGYFHRDPWVSSDILMSAMKPHARDRGLVKSKAGVFWEFPSDYAQRVSAKAKLSKIGR